MCADRLADAWDSEVAPIYCFEEVSVCTTPAKYPLNAHWSWPNLKYTETDHPKVPEGF